jgi:hypothetical protein
VAGHWNILSSLPDDPALLERPLSSDTGPAWKARRGRAELPDDQEPGVKLGLAAGELRRRTRRGRHVDGRSDEEDRGSAGGDQRQAPLQRNRRRRQSLRDCDTELLRADLLGPASYDPHIRKGAGDLLEELALPPVRLEQDDLALGQRRRERDTGRAPA